jgi:peptidoglycan/xylan/chitin deacetylase (PgdA/CDA1 family)
VAELADNPAGYVCLTFDFDGPSLWMQRGMTSPTSISRGEFGAVAVPRILRLLARRNLPATFFVPGHTIETYPAECAAIAAAGCEIALHGYAHELNATVPPDVERWAMDRSSVSIEALCGVRPTGYRAPSGELTEATIDLLVDHGLTYDSSLMGHDHRPYAVRRGDRFPADGPAEWGEETSIVELPWSWTSDDYVYLEFVAFRRSIMPGLRRPAEMFDNFSGDVRWMTANVGHGVYTVVFHPQVIGRGHRLLALETWLDEIAELGLAFARLGDVAAAHVAGRPFGLEPRPDPPGARAPQERAAPG